MPRDFSRIERVSELLRRVLAEAISREMDDPRADTVSITAVEVSKDLRHAKVFVTLISKQHDAGCNIEFLNRASGFLRKSISPDLHLKRITDLTFIYDNSVERGANLSRLIDNLCEADGKY